MAAPYDACGGRDRRGGRRRRRRRGDLAAGSRSLRRRHRRVRRHALQRRWLAAGHAPTARRGRNLRAEAFTYLTLPEWFIVYSTDEYGALSSSGRRHGVSLLRGDPPVLGLLVDGLRATRGRYPFETGYHVMLGVIGASFTVENAIKALYEHTVGRATEWLSTDTPEDASPRGVAAEYGAFMHTTPWYEFPFGERLAALWRRCRGGDHTCCANGSAALALTLEYSASRRSTAR